MTRIHWGVNSIKMIDVTCEKQPNNQCTMNKTPRQLKIYAKIHVTTHHLVALRVTSSKKGSVSTKFQVNIIFRLVRRQDTNNQIDRHT